MGLFSLPQSEVKRLERAKLELQKEIEAKQEEVANLQLNVHAKEELLKTRLNAITELEQRERKSATEQQKVTKEIERLQRERAMLLGAIDHDRKIRRTLEGDIEKQVRTLKEREKEFDRRVKELQTMQSNQEEQEKLLETKAKLLSTKSAELRSREAKLEKDESEYQSKKKVLLKELHALQHDINITEQKREEKVTQLHNLRHAVDELNAKAKEQEHIVDVAKEKSAVVAELVHTIANKREQLRVMENEERIMLGNLKKMERMKSSLEESVGALEAKQQKVLQDTSDLRKEERVLRSEVKEYQELVRKKEVWKQELDTEKVELNDLKKLLEKKNILLKEREAELADAVAKVEKLKKSLLDKDAHLLKEEKRLYEREALVQEKAQILEKQEKEVTGYRKQLELLEHEKEKVKSLRDEVDTKLKKLQNLDKVVRQKEEGLEQVYEERKQILDSEFKKQKAIWDQAIKGRKKELEEEYERRSKELESAYLKKSAEAERLAKEAQAKEKEMVGHKKEWLHREQEIREAFEYIKREKAQLDEDAKIAREQYETLVAEFEKRRSWMEENKAVVDSELKRVQRLQASDLKLLKEKEEELADVIAQMEKEKKTFKGSKERFESQGKVLKDREYNLAQWQEQLNAKERELRKREEHVHKMKLGIDRHQKIKAEIPELERRHAQLLKLVGDAQARVIGLELEPITIRNELKEQARAVQERAVKVEEEEKQVKKAKAQLKREEKRFIIDAQPALKSALKREIPLPPPVEDVPELAPQGVTGVLADARAALEMNDVDRAIRLVSAAELLIEKSSKDEQRSAMYDIRELKTSIKLASLY